MCIYIYIYTHIPTSCTLPPLSHIINASGRRSSACTTCNHASGHNRNWAEFASPAHFPIVHILVSCHPLKYSTIMLVSFNLPTSEAVVFPGIGHDTWSLQTAPLEAPTWQCRLRWLWGCWSKARVRILQPRAEGCYHPYLHSQFPLLQKRFSYRLTLKNSPWTRDHKCCLSQHHEQPRAALLPQRHRVSQRRTSTQQALSCQPWSGSSTCTSLSTCSGGEEWWQWDDVQGSSTWFGFGAYLKVQMGALK